MPYPEARALAAVLAKSDALREPYARHVHRIARLTDCLARSGVGLGPADTVDSSADAEAIFPASRGIDNLHGGGLAFLDAVKSGRCNLTPAPDSGFYRHQLFALTPLLLPEKTAEAPSRLIDPEYAEALGQLAALGLFFARETHVKQLEILELMEPARRTRTTVYPDLTVEPVPTFYRLTGDAFRFLRRVVAEGWGDASLGLPQVRAEGPVAQTVAAGIDEVIRSLRRRGRSLVAGARGPHRRSRCEALRARLRRLRTDPDAIEDARGRMSDRPRRLRPRSRDGLPGLGKPSTRSHVRFRRLEGGRKRRPVRHLRGAPCRSRSCGRCSSIPRPSPSSRVPRGVRSADSGGMLPTRGLERRLPLAGGSPGRP